MPRFSIAVQSWRKTIIRFRIDIACYGRSERLTVTAEVYGTNNDGDTIQLISEPVYCENGVTQTVVFKPSEKQSEKVKNIFKFDSVFRAAQRSR